MSRRNYSNSASVGTIQDAINNTDTATTSVLSSGILNSWPSTPCSAALNLGLADEEIVLVTAISGTSVTYTRGYNGSTERNHSAAATLTHVSIAEDFDEANAHLQAVSAVHGVTGNVVGTTDAQSLSNKTLLSPIIGDYTNAEHDHSSASQGGAIQQASVTGLPAALASKATDTLTAHLAGTETFTGAKTFTAAAAFSGGLTGSGGATIWDNGHMAIGTYSGNTDTNGFLTVTHGLSWSPSKVFLMVTSPTGGPTIGVPIISNVAPDATHFQLRHLLLSTGPYPATVAGCWLAFL